MTNQITRKSYTYKSKSSNEETRDAAKRLHRIKRRMLIDLENNKRNEEGTPEKNWRRRNTKEES
jgi:hypothetical protein